MRAAGFNPQADFQLIEHGDLPHLAAKMRRLPGWSRDYDSFTSILAASTATDVLLGQNARYRAAVQHLPIDARIGAVAEGRADRNNINGGKTCDQNANTDPPRQRHSNRLEVRREPRASLEAVARRLTTWQRNVARSRPAMSASFVEKSQRIGAVNV
jgi:hypothetical protein